MDISGRQLWLRIAFRQISKDGYKLINIERQRVLGAQTEATIICRKYILDVRVSQLCFEISVENTNIAQNENIMSQCKFVSFKIFFSKKRRRLQNKTQKTFRMPWYEYEPLLIYGCTRSRPGVQVIIPVTHTCKKREIPEIYLRKFFWIFRKILG